MIRAFYHSGRCCGITNIYMGDYGCTPDIVLDAKPKRNTIESPLTTAEVNSREYLFHDKEFPSETALERLDRIINLIVDKRPKGIIEIVLVDYRSFNAVLKDKPNPFDQVRQWEELILERGFQKVTECKNSNSGNRMHVYHLIKDDK